MNRLRKIQAWLTPAYALACWWAVRILLAWVQRTLFARPLLALSVTVLVVLLATWLALRGAAVRLVFHTPTARTTLGSLGLGACLVLPVAFLVDRLQLVLERCGSCAACSRVLLRGAPLDASSLLQLLVLGVLVSALAEELVFREFVFVRLRTVTGSAHAVLASALAFSLSHGAMASIQQALVLGIILGLVRSKTGSIVACILLHAAFNFQVSLLACMFPMNVTVKVPEYAADLPLPWLVLPLLGSWMAWRALPRTAESEPNRVLGASQS